MHHLTSVAPAFIAMAHRIGRVGVIMLEPWRLRVFPGTVLLGQGGQVLVWRETT